MKKFNYLKFFNEIYNNNNICDYNKNRWKVRCKKYKIMLMMMRNFQINYLKNFKLTIKPIAKVRMKKKVCTIIKKQKMILDTNLKLIQDGNTLEFYTQNGTMRLDVQQGPYQFVVLNIKNK